MEIFPIRTAWSGSTAGRDYGRDGLARAPGKGDIALSAAASYAGTASRWNPEELLAASLSTCHMLTFLALASKVKIDVRAYGGEAEAVLDTVDRVTRVTEVRLVPTITVAPGTDLVKAAQIFEKAHQYCFIAHSVSCGVVMAPRFVEG